MPSREALKTAHGALMLWAWGVLVPGVVLLGSVGRDLFGGGLWFKLHRATGVSAAVLTVGGLVLAKQIGTGVERARTHRLLGAAVAYVGAAQPAIAWLRPNPETAPDNRALWFLAHKWLGVASVALGLLNVWLGLRLWDPKDALSTVYAAGLVGALAVVVAWNVAAAM